MLYWVLYMRFCEVKKFMLDAYQSIITTEELAEILRLNERTVLKLVKEGKLPAMKIANQFRFSKEKIIAWLETQMNEYSDRLLEDIEKGISNVTVFASKIISPDNVIINLKSNNKVDAIKELIDAADKTGYVKNKENLLRHIYNREAQYTTAVGGGIAFPHPRTPLTDLVNKILIAIGISKNGIDFEAVDEVSVKIVVLLTVPSLSLHLKVLSHLTRVFNDETVRSNIMNAESPEEVIEIIMNKEDNLVVH